MQSGGVSPGVGDIHADGRCLLSVRGLARRQSGNRACAGLTGTGRLIRPLAVRCGAFGDMVLFTAMIRALHARFGLPVDIVTSGPWSEPLLRGQARGGRGMERAQPQDSVLAEAGTNGGWCGTCAPAARAQRGTATATMRRAPCCAVPEFPRRSSVDVKDHPLLPGEHATQQWLRLAQIMPAAFAGPRGGRRRNLGGRRRGTGRGIGCRPGNVSRRGIA